MSITGQMRQRVKVIRPAPVPGSWGEPDDTMESVYTGLRCAIFALTAREVQLAEQAGQAASHRMLCRRRVTPGGTNTTIQVRDVVQELPLTSRPGTDESKTQEYVVQSVQPIGRRYRYLDVRLLERRMDHD